jgi:hypothetical protein
LKTNRYSSLEASLENLAHLKNPKLSRIAGIRAATLHGGAAWLHYLVNAGLTFEPWMNVWQVTQGVTVVEPASRPCTPPAESGLWHWLHNVATEGMFSSRGFCDPCGVWQVVQPSALTGACS